MTVMNSSVKQAKIQMLGEVSATSLEGRKVRVCLCPALVMMHKGGFSLGISLDGLKGHYQNGTHPNQVTGLDSG